MISTSTGTHHPIGFPSPFATRIARQHNRFTRRFHCGQGMLEGVEVTSQAEDLTPQERVELESQTFSVARDTRLGKKRIPAGNKSKLRPGKDAINGRTSREE